MVIQVKLAVFQPDRMMQPPWNALKLEAPRIQQVEAVRDRLSVGVEGERGGEIVGVDDQHLQCVHVQVGGFAVEQRASMPLSRFTFIPRCAESDPPSGGAVRMYSTLYDRMLSRPGAPGAKSVETGSQAEPRKRPAPPNYELHRSDSPTRTCTVCVGGVWRLPYGLTNVILRSHFMPNRFRTCL